MSFSRVRIGISIALGLILALALLAPVPAGAIAGPICTGPGGISSSGTFDFEQGPLCDGRSITTEYFGGQWGLEFGSAADLGFTGFDVGNGYASGACDNLAGPISHIDTASVSRYHSGTQGLAVAPAGPGCLAGEFSQPGILLRCPTVCSGLSGYLGTGETAPGVPSTITVRTYAADGTRLSSTDVVQDASSSGANTPFDLRPGGTGPDFSYALFLFNFQQGGWLDDLTYTNDTAAVPTWHVSPQVSTASATPGTSTQPITFILSRSNNSTGTLTPKVDGLPFGVTADPFSPFPGIQGGPFVVTLHVSSGVAPGGTYLVTVTMNTGSSLTTGAGNTATISLTIQPAVTLDIVPNFNSTYACAPNSGGVRLQAHGFTGVATPTALIYDVTKKSYLLASASFSPSTVSFTPQTQTQDISMSWSVSPGNEADNFLVTINVTASGLGGIQSQVERFYSIHPAATTPVARYVTVPIGQAGSTVTVDAAGLCGNVTARFGNDKAMVPVTGQLLFGGPFSRYTVAVPRYATSGSLTLSSSGGQSLDAGPVTVTSERPSHGFPFVNYKPFYFFYDGSFTSAFGRDQTYDSFNPCWPFDCTKSWRDPVSMMYAAAIRTQLGQGHCYGMTLAEAQLLHGDLSTSSFVNTGGDAFHVPGAPGDKNGPTSDPALFNYLDTAHLRQFGFDTFAAWAAGAPSDLNLGAFVNNLNSMLSSGGPVLLSMDGDSGAHVVLAYAVEQIDSTHYRVDVLDSNRPYTDAETTDGSGVTHAMREDASSLILDANGWVFPDPGAALNGGYQASGSWGSYANPLVPISYAVANGRQRIPTVTSPLLWPMVLLGFGSTDGSSSPVHQVGQAGTLLPIDSASPGFTALSLPKSGGSVTLAGTRTGTYSEWSFGPGSSSQVTAPALPAVQDVVTSNGGGVSLRTGAIKRITLTSIAMSGAGAVTATGSMTSPKGGTESLAITHGGVTAGGSGGGTIALTVTVAPRKGTPSTQSFTVPVTPGDSISVPAAAILAHGPSLALVITNHGRKRAATVRATTVRVAAIAAPTIASRVVKGNLTVTAGERVLSASPAVHGWLQLTVRRGSKVVATREVTIALVRRGGITGVLKARLPRGTYTVDVGFSALPASGTRGVVATGARSTVVVH